LLTSIYIKAAPEPVRKIICRIKQGIKRKIHSLLVLLAPCARFTKLAGIYRDTVIDRKKISQYYNSDKHISADCPKTVIFMADGKTGCGGLSDRLRGIVSVYKICKELNVRFRINFTSPFNLTDYLLPNSYDWRILPDEICFNPKYANPCFIWDIYDCFHEKTAQEFWAGKFIKENYRQIHIYTNMMIAEEEYGVLFHELFKPAAELENLINYNLKRLGGGGEFISVAFRFLQLLGDFRETVGSHTILPDEEKKILVYKCLQHLHEIYSENTSGKTLVTSDSISFLEEAKKLPFVYVIPGDVRHIDIHQNIGRGADLKLFLDYFLLSYSKKVYLVAENQMHHTSGFSYRAALLNRVPFIVKCY
jgi:hypothetical protein